MLSSVLNSPRAIQVSILVVESFLRLRELTAANRDIMIRVQKLERSHDRTASVIEVLVEDIDNLVVELKRMKAVPPSPKCKIGFDLWHLTSSSPQTLRTTCALSRQSDRSGIAISRTQRRHGSPASFRNDAR
jgi:hypothetical protein